MPRFFSRTVSAVLIAVFCLALGSCGKKREKPLLVGDMAPEFQVTDLSGRVVSNPPPVAGPMIIRFFDPYCRFCKADTAVFNEYYEKHKDQGLQVVYIDTDPDVAKIQEFIKELAIEFPVYVDADKKLANLFRIKVIPQTLVIDPGQKIIAGLLGGVAKAELDDLLAEHLH